MEETVLCPDCGKECKNLGAHQRFCVKRNEVKSEAVEPKKEEVVAPKEEIKAAPIAAKKSGVVLKNVLGQDMDVRDYFYKGVVPSGFQNTCGLPVDREELLSVFNKVFKPSDNILFYKKRECEIYIVIVPLKYSASVGASQESLDGDFQKHAMSFITEGSVNSDTLRKKLEMMKKFVKYDDR